MFPEQLDDVGNRCAARLQPTESILTAYNGTGIACIQRNWYRTVDINCSYDGQEWRKTKLFVVDVPGTAILGLSTCEALHIEQHSHRRSTTSGTSCSNIHSNLTGLASCRRHISWWSTRTYLLGSTRHAEH